MRVMSIAGLIGYSMMLAIGLANIRFEPMSAMSIFFWIFGIVICAKVLLAWPFSHQGIDNETATSYRRDSGD